MFKNSMLMIQFFILWMNLLLIFTNYSFMLYFEYNFFFINISMSYVALWFTFFMGFMIFFFMFLLTKKMVSYTKYCILMLVYLFIFYCVVMLIFCDDFIYFMMLFESLFFPMCFMSLFFCFNNSFMFAIYYLIIFSSLSSVLCISICLIMILHFNTLNLNFFSDICFFDSLYLNIFIWIFLFLMFAIKYPIWPLHVWLPEMHVEVNSEMSALLASIVLKMGFFGIFKFIFMLWNNTAIWFMGFIDSIIMLGMTFLTMSLLFLCDYKKIIAHWSVIHTGVGLMLLWHNDLIFIGILFFCNLGHMLSSGFMFIIMGFMYDNYGLSMFLLLISFFGISIWSSIFLALFLFNMDFPFMLLFFIDIFVLYGLISLSFIYMFFFFIMAITIFISSLFIYLTLSFFSFIWLDKYLSLDLTVNDMFFFFLMAGMCFLFFFLIYFIF